jgi:hypothetical protein
MLSIHKNELKRTQAWIKGMFLICQITLIVGFRKFRFFRNTPEVHKKQKKTPLKSFDFRAFFGCGGRI